MNMRALPRDTLHPFHYANNRIYGLIDSLHLSAAIEFGCDRFVTNDARLTNFPEMSVEILP